MARREYWKDLDFFFFFPFPLGRLTVHPMQVKGWIWNWFHNTLGKFLRETLRDVPRLKKIVFFFFSSSITGVPLTNLHEPRMSHELFSARWNTYYKADLNTEHVSSCYRRCFFHWLLGYVNGKTCEKAGIVLKNRFRECRRRGSAGWLCGL